MNSEKLNRRKKVGGPSNDPTNITYGRANPFAEQGPNNVDTDPRVAGSFNAQAPAFNGQMGAMQNPYGDAAISTPAMFTPGGNGGIAPFSGNMQRNMPGQGLNRMPPDMIPAFNQAGSAPDTDGQESMRIAGEVQQKFGLFANAMGLANPGMQPVPGGSVPANIQTQSTLPLMGAQGGIAQESKGGKRGSRGPGGMTT